MALAATVTFKPLCDLHPDPENPRLRHDQRGTMSDDELLEFVAATYEPIVIAESIARHGFFGSEPLIVTEEDRRWIVLEGNRRLTALLGLARPELRAHFGQAQTWEELADRRSIPLDMSVPLLEADEREDADAVIGFRHISGVEGWKPLQRAQYIAYLVDTRDKSFLEVSDTVGEGEDVVRMYYRNQSILEKARALGRDDLADASERRFGTFTAALNRTGIRDFLGVRVVSAVREGYEQLHDDKIGALEELSSWLYGADGREKIITDTRNLTELAEILRAPKALQELRRSQNLLSAYALTPGPPKRLLRQLATAVGHLRSVANSAELIAGEARTEELVEELEERTGEIVEAVREGDA
ncbi:MAG TPA: hypothetical protein VGL54_11490 [Solirubrobacteraceae bacterium]